jgi:hypothetical protein
MSAKADKSGSHHEMAAEHHDTPRTIIVKRPSIMKQAITRRRAITPIWRMRTNSMRSTTGTRLRNTTLNTTNKFRPADSALTRSDRSQPCGIDQRADLSASTFR